LNEKEVIIPCHRHCDAFQILKAFGMRRDVDFEEIAQGFLDENDNFMTRAEAWQEARRCYQFLDSYIEKYCDNINPPTILYSEDVW
jgi:hypothetical protein